MEAMKIAFFEAEGWEESALKAAFPNDELVLSKEKLSEANIPMRTDFDIVSIFVGSMATEKVLAAFPNLKFLTTRSVGFDHVDTKTAASRGIAVAYVPGYGDNTVAEFAFGLLLNLTRNIYHAIENVKMAGSFSFEGLRGVDIKGKTMGIVGTGRIGKEAIKIAKGFGMDVIAYDLFPDAAAATALGFSYMALGDLLAKADMVSIHCPLTDQTRHLLNRENMMKMKKGSYLVNTARGGIVETDGLVMALEAGIIRGAALDVIEEERETKDELDFLTHEHHIEDFRTVVENHMLMKMPNVLVTPHNAFNSQEALERILKTTIENIQSFEAGTPKNLVPQSGT
jgi:D-lactate dehydrogenase